MKYTNLESFKKHVESAAPHHLSPIYLLLAKESYPKKEAAQFISQIFLQGEVSPELATSLFDGEKQSVDLPLSELNSLSFFSRKKLVIFQRCDTLNKAATTRLETYFATPNKNCCFILTAEGLNRSTSFYKKAEKFGVILDIPELKSWEKEKIVIHWLQEMAQKANRQLTPNAAQTLVKQTGTDQTLLENELRKLICYVGNRQQMTEQDVAAICTSINQENGWQIGDAIFRQDAATAIKVSSALLRDGTALIALIRQIRFQFQTQYQICSLLSNGSSHADIAAQYPYLRGATLEKQISTSQAYGMGRFKHGITAIDKAELKAKNSNTDEDLILTILIATLTNTTLN